MYQQAQVEEERRVWGAKPQLRVLKQDYYAQIRSLLPRGGRVVELGSGCGGLKESMPEVIASDLFPTPWVDVALAAQAIPFADSSIDALVGLDVLRHLEEPLSFFREAARVLRPGGKIILLDPYVSVGSWLSWHYIHHEGCSLQESFDFSRPFPAENNARATLWFDRNRLRMEEMIRPLRIERTKTLDLFYYPLTGGFRPWALVPAAVAPAMLRADRWLERWFGKWLGYRMLIVMRKEGTR